MVRLRASNHQGAVERLSPRGFPVRDGLDSFESVRLMTDRNPDETTSENERTPTGADVSVGDVSPEQADRPTPATYRISLGQVDMFLPHSLRSESLAPSSSAWCSARRGTASPTTPGSPETSPCYPASREEDRPTYTGLLGAVVGVWLTVWAYRRAGHSKLDERRRSRARQSDLALEEGSHQFDDRGSS